MSLVKTMANVPSLPMVTLFVVAHKVTKEPLVRIVIWVMKMLMANANVSISRNPLHYFSMITLLFISIAKCSKVICQNKGECAISTDGKPVCKCADGFYGELCANKYEDKTTSDDDTLVIVASVLGSICFVLICVIIAFACLVKKGSKDGKDRQSTTSDVPEIEIRPPTQKFQETSFSGVAQPSVYSPQPQQSLYDKTEQPTVLASNAPGVYAAPSETTVRVVI